MSKMSFMDKLSVLLNVSLSSKLFIALFIVLLIIGIILIKTNKNNAKRNRNIYFIILIANKELFKQNYSNEVLEIIKANSMLHFVCNKDKILNCKVNYLSNTVIEINE